MARLNLNPVYTVFGFWLVTRVISWFLFAPTLPPDSNEYIEIAQKLERLSLERIEIDRPFGYSVFLAALDSNPKLVVLVQQLLSLLIGLDIYKSVFSARANFRVAVFSALLYLSFPLTIFLEFQVLSEILSAFFIVKIIKLLLVRNNIRTVKSVFQLILLSVFVGLVRPNLIILCISFALVVFSNGKIAHTFWIRKFGLVSFFLSTFLLISVINTAVAGKPFLSGNALSSGVSMHMLDTIPSYGENPTLRDLIIEEEINLREKAPGSRYWAIQNGAQKYTDLGLPGVEVEVSQMGLHLVRNFPIFYVESVLKSFFSSSYSNVNGFMPVGNFSIPIALMAFSYLYSVIIQAFLFLALTRSLITSFVSLKRIGFKHFSSLDFLIPNAILVFMLINALVSPVEQNRYLFPSISLIIVLMTRKIQAGFHDEVRK